MAWQHFIAAVFVAVVVIGVGWPTVVVVRRVRRLRRANRVAPGRATAAPLWWMWTPGPAAVLHRRLRAAVAGARYAVAMTGVAPVDPLRDSLRELEEVAATLDDGVVAAATIPRPMRTRLLHEMAIDVGRLERTADQLCATANRFVDTHAAPKARLAAVHERLRAVDQAVDEVRRIETDASIDLRSSEPAPPARDSRRA